MTIKYSDKNILFTGREALVNPVNCVGIMGKGLALQFKNTFPENFVAYKKECKQGNIKLGHVFVFPFNKNTHLQSQHLRFIPRFIINFPTKNHWRDKSKIEDIRSGLQDLVKQIQLHNIRSIAIPAIGCGLGGLEWNVVRDEIESALTDISQTVDIAIYNPYNPNREIVKK